jgi:hypothetical protein
LYDSDRIVEMQRFFRKAPKPHVDSFLSSNSSHEVSSAEQDSPSNSALRPPIFHYNQNDRDRICRYYLTTGSCQPYNCDFLQNNFSGVMRRFNIDWFDKYKTWLEYSTSKDAVLCLPCYLFRPKKFGSGGRINFVGEGF